MTQVLSQELIQSLEITKYSDFDEILIKDFYNIKLKFNQVYIKCIDIDIDNKENIMKLLNIYLIGKSNITIEILKKCLLKVINKLEVFANNKKYNFEDNLFLFEKEVKSKNNISKMLILEKFKTINFNKSKNINELNLNHKQIFEIIFSEVDKINKNFNYKHYVDFKDNDPYQLCFRYKYTEGELGNKLRQLNELFGFDYIEIILNLDNSLYPLIPPTIVYSKPNMSIELIHNLKNINILHLTKWNSNISLEWLLIEIGNKFEKYFSEYIDITSKELNICEIDKEIFKLFNLMGVNEYKDFKINFEVPNFQDNKSIYWNSGTGYGYQGTTNWNISEFIEKQDLMNKNVIDILKNIKNMYNYIKDIDKITNVKKILTNFISNQLRGTNLLDFNKNIQLYNEYLFLIKEMTLNIKTDIIIDLYDEISNIMNNEEIKAENNLNIHAYSLFIILFKDDISIFKNTISEETENEYETMVRENMFDKYTLDGNHRYYKNLTICKSKNKKRLLRIIGEISSLKKNLPINWDTSCVLRVDNKNTSFIKFVITGPKDTPYHNGIYEFHAYFPENYPNVPPLVLLNTTDGGKVRFNPNLYACGKVCLSLLGTWSGQEGEKWNSEISTFLQVIISIQSLIMVDEPYFNEPGYERTMNTEAGKKKAFDYKDSIRQQNIKVAILNQLKNPPAGFEKFTINHFKLKKNEIIETVDKWQEETYSPIKMEAFKNEFLELLKEK